MVTALEQRRMNRQLMRQKRKTRATAVLAGIFFLLAAGLAVALYLRINEVMPEGAKQEGLLVKKGMTVVNGSAMIDAPFIDQREKYPTGCESVSVVMALQYLGIDITPEEFIGQYLPKGNAPYRDENNALVGCDPRKAFPGDPCTELGWGCYAPVIEGAVNQALGEAPYRAKATCGETLDTLCSRYTDRGVPVLLWVTIDMAPATTGDTWRIEGSEEEFSWIEPMHCALLVGRDTGSYYFNDPMAAKACAYSKEDVEAAYEALGKQAVVISPEA